MIHTIYLFLICILIIYGIQALDVSWIPADAEGPLPLSNNYRKNLRSLCEVTAQGTKVPPDAESKKEAIIKLCRLLQEADKYTTEGVVEGENSSRTALVVVGLSIAAAWYYFNKGPGSAARPSTPQSSSWNPSSNSTKPTTATSSLSSKITSSISSSLPTASTGNTLGSTKSSETLSVEEQKRIAREARQLRFGAANQPQS